jgi:hypothetical protein
MKYMLYTTQTMPYKIILIHKLYGTKYNFYKSDTDYLSFEESKFNMQILQKRSDNDRRGREQSTLLPNLWS